MKSSAHAVQVLSGLSSPPIVFKTPRTKQPSETNVLKRFEFRIGVCEFLCLPSLYHLYFQFLLRSQSLQLSIAEAPQNIDRGKDDVDGSVDSEQFVTVCQNGLIADTQKDCNVDEFFETHPSSSSGCVDEFLADPGGADCGNSVYSDTPGSKNPNNASKFSQGCSKETMLELDDRNGVGRDVGTEQAETDIHGEPKVDAKSVGIVEKEMDGEWSSYECLNIKTNLHVGPLKDCQNSPAQAQVTIPSFLIQMGKFWN